MTCYAKDEISKGDLRNMGNRTNAKEKWYGVYAQNGLGIYYNYGRLLRNSMYTVGEHVKKFDTREEAEEYAIDGFLQLHDEGTLLATIPGTDELGANYFYYKVTPKTER